MSYQRLAALTTALVVGVLAAAACSGDGGGDAVPGAGGPSLGEIQTQPEPVQASGDLVESHDGLIEVHISGAQFVQNELGMTAGEPVKIRVLNEDGQPHNLRIAGFDGVFQTEDDAVTAPETIEAGGVGELIFAPPVAGSYTFRCDFHPGSMGGRIVVR